MGMKRTNFFFPAQLLKRLAKVSKQTGFPMSQIIREAVDAKLVELERRPQEVAA